MALAAIGEKEWFFYVPRDRKYRNGDRPNRVTTSGYWKATGADRMIRGDQNNRPIGLKKTLVFYSGKAPKGIRTSWIMNEYRLPHHETERYQKAEISLCRVYKRAGVEDHPLVPRGNIPSRLSSSSKATSSASSERKNYHNAFRAQTTSLQQQMEHYNQQHQSGVAGFQLEKVNEMDASSSTEVGTALGLSHPTSYSEVSPLIQPQPHQQSQPLRPPFLEVNRMMHLLNDHPNLKQQVVGSGSNGGGGNRDGGIRGGHCVITSMPSSATQFQHQHYQQPQVNTEDIQRLVEYQQACINHHFQQQQQQQQQQHHHQQQFQFESLTNSSNPNNTGNSTNNMPFLFSNYLFSPAQTTLVNNPPTTPTPTATAVDGESSTSLQLPPVTGAGIGGGHPFHERSIWDWNLYSEPNTRDHFSNLFK
ncbi:NAC domain-containing protein 35-like isoform X2 [Amaranthus tricolor]|uniref:NAC domain-containing protein 35-like isoform X2 n=1 Tax=Amaranthus tricolor TaxID=29722 RepID=UPI002588E0EA|nr:NAC domain-containing protein 35-like isoform X2 [Amaranthus tricolor]